MVSRCGSCQPGTNTFDEFAQALSLRIRFFMRRILARYAWVKVTVLLIAVAGFVLLYESQMLDSRNAAWQSMTNPDGSPVPGARLPFNATAYCKGTTTASGVNVRSGIAAADPQLLPVGSVLNLAVGDDRYNGIYTVMDTGPKVQGRVLDLYMWNCHEALRFGRKNVQVTVLRLGWDPRASAPTLIDRLFRRREATRKPPPDDPEPDTETPSHETIESAPANPEPPAPAPEPDTEPSSDSAPAPIPAAPSAPSI
jgi:3D (Asp-Asp-Asp) domain-containing protein